MAAFATATSTGSGSSSTQEACERLSDGFAAEQAVGTGTADDIQDQLQPSILAFYEAAKSSGDEELADLAAAYRLEYEDFLELLHSGPPKLRQVPIEQTELDEAEKDVVERCEALGAPARLPE